MNQRIIIYIILSAILLYLYYRRQDITIFAAFMVVVGSTLIFRDTREGLNVGSIGGGGGGGGGDACKKMGFTKPKLDNDDPEGSLETMFKKIKTVADEYWPYDTDTPDDKKVDLNKFVEQFQAESKKLTQKESKSADHFIVNAYDAYEKKRPKQLLAQNPEDIVLMISGGEITLKILDIIIKSDETASGFKKQLKYLKCLCKHWISIIQEIKKVNDSKKDANKDKDDEPKKDTKKKEEDE
jgi:hypothetical protein